MYSASAILAIALLLQVSPPPAGDRQQEPSHQVQDYPTPTQPTINNQISSVEQGEGSKTEPKQGPQKPPWWDVTWATWGLVVIGFFGTLAALCTLQEIRKSTEAAKANADALINSERAWVIIELVELNSGDIVFNRKERVSVAINDDGTDTTTVNFPIKCRNEGRTPAWITEKLVKFEVVKAIPQEPNFSDARPFQWDFLSLRAGGDFECFIRPDNIGQRIREKDISILYGIIKYRDIFGMERSTTFGYRLIMPIGILSMLPRKYAAYNENK